MGFSQQFKKGNVGIGTMSPGGRLDVNGAIYQRGSLLHADYVFEPGYELESIEEHAAYMWQNKHLKAVPRAQKDEQGQDVLEIVIKRCLTPFIKELGVMERKRGFVMLVIVALFLGTVDMCETGETSEPKAYKSEKHGLATEKAEVQPGGIVYKFKNRQEMEEFQIMHQQVQFINNRIAVLQDYLVQERANLEQLNAQMFLKFKFVLEPNRQYRLDTVDMTITEITPAQGVQTQSPSINPANPCPGDT